MRRPLPILATALAIQMLASLHPPVPARLSHESVVLGYPVPGHGRLADDRQSDPARAGVATAAPDASATMLQVVMEFQ